MKEKQISFSYHVYAGREELTEQDAMLLDRARAAAGNAYAPYSNFRVGAAALLANGEVVTGSNQENASYPVGICAERVLLGNAAVLFEKQPILTLAISYRSRDEKSDHPISPCGMCRQAILEYETRMKQPMRLILGGMEGEVYVIESAGQLLPLGFTKNELK